MPDPAVQTLDTRGIEQTREVIEAYIGAMGNRVDLSPFFTDDVALALVEAGQEIRGREAVAAAIAELHQATFDARPEVANLVIGDGNAACEFVFIGTHTGEFGGIPASGRQVRVPYTVFYDLSRGRISALRILGFASGLVAQLSGAEAVVANTSAQ